MVPLTWRQVEQMAGLLAQGEGQSMLNTSDQALGWWDISCFLQSPSKGLGLLPTQDRNDFEIL